MENKPLHRYNWRRDLPDPRDFKFAKTYMCMAAPPPPPMADLRLVCPPIVDQGQLGSCTGNSLAGALGFLELREIKAGLAGQAEEFSPSFTPFSRLFIYWNERSIEGDTDQDGGAQIRDGIKSLATTGCCSELTWPYNVDAAFTPPAGQCFAEANLHKISTYMALDNSNINELKTCLASGYPFVFGFTVYDSFESAAAAQTGMMQMPGENEGSVGGHAVMCVGYDDSRQVFIIRNSWGTRWGDNGYFYMPYSYMTDPDLVDDLWTIRK